MAQIQAFFIFGGKLSIYNQALCGLGLTIPSPPFLVYLISTVQKKENNRDQWTASSTLRTGTHTKTFNHSLQTFNKLQDLAVKRHIY